MGPSRLQEDFVTNFTISEPPRYHLEARRETTPPHSNPSKDVVSSSFYRSRKPLRYKFTR